MSGDFWGAQRAMAYNDLMDVGGRMGADFLARREQKKLDESLRVEYVQALAKAKDTGVMPAHLQAPVPADYMGEQAGIKVVALRELGKRAPTHPLVNSQGCRDAVASVTLIQYNRADRPSDRSYDEFAPSEEVAKRIFDAY